MDGLAVVGSVSVVGEAVVIGSVVALLIGGSVVASIVVFSAITAKVDK